MGRLRYSLILILSFFTIHLSFAEARYVSHSGSNTPPYLTWETAADSIMSAINISSFGDTIYVANGVYEEQVLMIPGLSLIGAGMDSCVIDTRALVNSNGFISIDVPDSCVLKGFDIMPYYNSTKGYGIAVRGTDTISSNKISTAWRGMYVGYTGTKKPIIYENSFSTVSVGIEIFNSSPLIQKNIISVDINSSTTIKAGMTIEAFDYTYKPVIDSNIIFANHSWGIDKSYGTRPIISNNIILMDNGSAMFLSYSDTIRIFNNLIFGYGTGIDHLVGGTQHMLVYNNYIGGDIGFAGIEAGPGDTIENNVIANADIAIKKLPDQPPPTIRYNNLWDDSIKFSGFTNTDTTNIYKDPMAVNDDSTRGDLDFHLQAFSPLIDRGDPSILDKDGSRSDIGLYGGPLGESYKYQDLPPRIPVNMSAYVDSDYILLKWNRNTEADFNHYNLYRDTTENFRADSTTFVISVADTFYLHIIPQGIPGLYFKLTAVDNQGNESEASDELHVFLTETIKNEQFTIDNYKLFQNYPNPFNPSTKIGYRLKERAYVKLYVYDIKGELVETLVNRYQESGYYEVEFTGGRSEDGGQRSENGHQRSEVGSLRSEGSSLASGVYIYQIMVKNENGIPVFSDVKKMVLLK